MPLRRLDHLLVLTDDLEATRAFYCDALGLEAGERPPLEFPGYWLYLDGVAVRARRRARGVRGARGDGSASSVGPAPVDHVAFAAPDYDGLAARLEAAGVEAVDEHRARRGAPPALRHRPERGPDRAQRPGGVDGRRDARASERERRRLLARRDPLPLGPELEVGDAAEVAAVARAAEARRTARAAPR